MYRTNLFISSILIFLFSLNADSATWEKLYVKKSTDCFRSVREVPAGGFVLAGYTSNFTPNDTDGLVVRMNDNGDILWTYVYNGPSSKEDLFFVDTVAVSVVGIMHFT